MVCGMLRCCFAARCTQHEAADIMIMSCIALQTLLSGLSGAAIGGGFSVSTWAPYLCILPSSVLSLVWAQFALFIAALPLAAGLAHLSPRVSTYFWKSKPGLANYCNVILQVQVCRCGNAVFTGVLLRSQSIQVCILSSVLDSAGFVVVCDVDGLCAHGNTWRDNRAEPHHWPPWLCFRTICKHQ
jgi:hypothetical protein